MTGVLLVDDQPMIRAGLGLILRAQPGLEVVGECEDGSEVPEAVDRLRPDVVCMDVRMPGVDGVEATRRLRDGGGPPVCILTTFGEEEILWAAVDAGAAGFELKSATPENLIEAVRTVAAGGTWIDGSLLGPIIDAFRRSADSGGPSTRLVEPLTDREHDVLRLMARGATNQEIAEQLFLASSTVKTHVSAIFHKVGARDRAAAIVYAYDVGLVTPQARRS
jgi:DNA-binding NarL/FixJ family response regulator